MSRLLIVLSLLAAACGSVSKTDIDAAPPAIDAPPPAPDAPGSCHDASECSALTAGCLEGQCVGHVCMAMPVTDGTSCDDGMYCTVGETCKSGMCGNGMPRDCSTGNTCVTGSCDETMGACVGTPAPNSTPCEDGNPCTIGDICGAGVCQPGLPPDCTAFDDQCNTGMCDPASGNCRAVPMTDGIACDDGNDCTGNDACSAGACTGNPMVADGNACDDGVACTTMDTCMGGVCAGTVQPCPGTACNPGVCDTAAGGCTNTALVDGTACDDSNFCTGATTCTAGVCGGGTAINEGAMCDDGNSCTSGTVCIAGGCTGGTGPTVYFSDDFHDNSHGWTLGPEWQIGSAMASTGQTYNGPDPAQDHSSSADNGVAGVVIGGNEDPVIHPYYYLTSPPFNTATATGSVILGFYRWLNSDYDPYMHDSIDVWNGAAWVNVFLTDGPPGVADSAWTYESYDLTAYKNAAMQIRFGYDIGAAGVFTVSSWNIDDVLVANATCP
jgi:hypothetical protein